MLEIHVTYKRSDKKQSFFSFKEEISMIRNAVNIDKTEYKVHIYLSIYSISFLK